MRRISILTHSLTAFVFTLTTAAIAAPGEVTDLAFQTKTDFSWNLPAGTAASHVYRALVSQLPSDAGDCFLGNVQSDQAADPDTPLAGQASFYLISAIDASGEGTLGTTGVMPRIPNTHCVPARRIFDSVPDGDPGDGVQDGFDPLRNPSAVSWESRREQAGVYLHTGEFYYSSTDAMLHGRGTDWELHRTYRSQANYDGPLGHNWDFNQNARLAPLGSDVIFHDGNGRRDVFGRTGSMTFDSPTGRYDVLIENPDGSFSMRSPLGTIYDFHAFDGSNLQGVQESIQDRNGNTISYQYDHQGLLVSSVDTLGRNATFQYYDDGRLESVTDFANRTCVYEYDSEGNLISSRSPTVTGTPTGNDFPSGKTTTYTYSTGFVDEKLNHDLLTVTMPNEQPGGPATLTMIYNTGGAPFELGRLESWTVGGTNSTGIPAGGAYAFTYTSVNPGADPLDLTIPRRVTQVTDRNGNIEEHVHNHPGNHLKLTEFTNRNVRPGEGDYVTSWTYTQDGELSAVIDPEGHEIHYTYDSPGLDRYREGNVLEIRHVAGPRGDGRGSPAADIVNTFTYDGVFNRPRTKVDGRGNDPAYVPQNGGPNSPARYTIEWLYDYQEGDPAANGINALASRFHIDLTGVAFNLGDLNGDGIVDQAGGNIVRRDYPSVTLDPGSFQAGIEGDTSQEIITTFEYNAFGQKIAEVNPEHNRSVFEYYPENDPDGDGSPSPAPLDGRSLDTSDGGYEARRTYDVTSDPARNNGYDPTPASIEQEFLYDPVGNETGAINGRGVLTSRLYNELDQLIRTRRAAATSDASGPGGEPQTGRGESGLTPFGFETLYYYDANDNVVRIEVEDTNLDSGSGPTVDTTFEYDILDNVVTNSQEASTTVTLGVGYRYDANENRVREILPEGNEHTTTYDERDLVFELTRGATGPRGGTPSTSTADYDGNRNAIKLTDSLGNVVDHVYDGYDRLVTTIDRVGNTIDRFYNPVDSLVRQLWRGPVGGPTPADRLGTTNVGLRDHYFLYDELNRVFRFDQELFVPLPPARPALLDEGPAIPGDGFINTVYEYDAMGRMTLEIRDSGSVTESRYDGVDRLIEIVRPDGSPTLHTYDGNHNLIEMEEVELASPPGPPDERFFTTYFYDALDRRERVVDNAGQTTHFQYDSRDLLLARADANGPPGPPINRRSPGNGGIAVMTNDPGNVTRFTYDGADRKIREEVILTPSGFGDGSFNPAPDLGNPFNPDGLIVREWQYDGNTLLTTRIDDNGNVTTYEYDNLSRLVRREEDDQTAAVFVLDTEDNVIQVTDANGTTATHTYDNAYRRTGTSVTPGTGVVGTTMQTAEYDGLDRLTLGFDNNSGAADDDVTITMVFDSLGRVIEETQLVTDGSPLAIVDYGWRAADLKTEIIYPAGRVIERFYDGADRLVATGDPGAPGLSTDYEYFGMERVHTQIRGNGVRTTRLDDPGNVDIGFDDVRRTVLLRHLAGGGAELAGFDYTYDRAGNRTSGLRRHDPAGPDLSGEIFFYDSRDRLVESERNFFDANRNPAGPPADVQIWRLDGMGNWNEWERNGQLFGATPNGLNEYDEPQSGGTRVDDGLADDFRDDLGVPGPDGLNLIHDRNGNRTNTGNFTIEFDFRDRPVTATRDSDGLLVVEYVYDYLDRRVLDDVSNSGGLDQDVRYVNGSCYDERDLQPYRRDCELEEQDPAGNPIRQVVYGAGSDELLWYYDQASQPFYFLQDDPGSVIAIIDVNNPPNLLERYVFDPYGRPVIQDQFNNPVFDSGNFLAQSQFQNDNFFLGWHYDPVTGLRTNDQQTDLVGMYYWGGSFYDPNLGRYLTRTTELWNDYGLSSNNPTSYGDYTWDFDAVGPAADYDYSDCWDEPYSEIPCYFEWDSCSGGRCGGSVPVDYTNDAPKDDYKTSDEKQAVDAAKNITSSAGAGSTGKSIVDARKAKDAQRKLDSASDALKNNRYRKTLQNGVKEGTEGARKASKFGTGMQILEGGLIIYDTAKKHEQTLKKADEDNAKNEKGFDDALEKTKETYKGDPKKIMEHANKVRKIKESTNNNNAVVRTVDAIEHTVNGTIDALGTLIPIPGFTDGMRWICGAEK